MPARWLVGLVAILAVAPPALAQVCGQEHHPDVGSFDPEAVVDAELWQSFLDRGGFTGALEGEGPVAWDVLVPGTPTHRFTVTLEPVDVEDYVGGSVELGAVLRLRAVETVGAAVTVHNFSHVSFGGRPGGRIALVADANASSLSIFWRWTWIECEGEFPISYYVFHASVEGSVVAEDNTLVYFEAERPRRPPPVDLILLITAGISVSVIFLLARRALRKGPDD